MNEEAITDFQRDQTWEMLVYQGEISHLHRQLHKIMAKSLQLAEKYPEKKADLKESFKILYDIDAKIIKLMVQQLEGVE